MPGLLKDGERWRLELKDCIPHMMEDMPESSVDMAVFSPPFPQLYAYTALPEDLGNSEDMAGSAKLHLGFFYRGLSRVLKPGRVAVVHVAQIPVRQTDDVNMGRYDYRGLNIRMALKAGLVYDYDWLVTKNPQAQAVRTHKHELLFVTMGRDGCKSSGAMGDYLIKFRKKGINEVPVKSDKEVTREEWIRWAEAAWTDIKQGDTLQTRGAKGPNDTRHVCPLQLEVIRRLIKLFSNKDDLVFSPFAGIGSEGYVAMKEGRRFYGCEIKPEYYDTATRNLRAVERSSGSREFF